MLHPDGPARVQVRADEPNWSGTCSGSPARPFWTTDTGFWHLTAQEHTLGAGETLIVVPINAEAVSRFVRDIVYVAESDLATVSKKEIEQTAAGAR